MSVHLQKELDGLRKKLLSVSALAEESLNDAVRSVSQLDVVLAKRVVEADRSIDSTEVEVEEECLKVLALHQPVANDLRFVVASLKINNDLERIGDLACNIAKRVQNLVGKSEVAIPYDFEEMAGKVRTMVHNSIESFVRWDKSLAEDVCRQDDEVDKINREMYAKVFKEIQRQPEHVETLVYYLTVSRNLERIADYATNIAEDVIYMIDGMIVRHGPGAHKGNKEF